MIKLFHGIINKSSVLKGKTNHSESVKSISKLSSPNCETPKKMTFTSINNSIQSMENPNKELTPNPRSVDGIKKMDTEARKKHATPTFSTFRPVSPYNFDTRCSPLAELESPSSFEATHLIIPLPFRHCIWCNESECINESNSIKVNGKMKRTRQTYCNKGSQEWNENTDYSKRLDSCYPLCIKEENWPTLYNESKVLDEWKIFASQTTFDNEHVFSPVFGRDLSVESAKLDQDLEDIIYNKNKTEKSLKRHKNTIDENKNRVCEAEKVHVLESKESMIENKGKTEKEESCKNETSKMPQASVINDPLVVVNDDSTVDENLNFVTECIAEEIPKLQSIGNSIKKRGRKRKIETDQSIPVLARDSKHSQKLHTSHEMRSSKQRQSPQENVQILDVTRENLADIALQSVVYFNTSNTRDAITPRVIQPNNTSNRSPNSALHSETNDLYRQKNKSPNLPTKVSWKLKKSEVIHISNRKKGGRQEVAQNDLDKESREIAANSISIFNS